MASGFAGGRGTYTDDDGVVRASIAGHMQKHQESRVVDVVRSASGGLMARDLVVRVDSVVTALVTKITMNQAIVDILTVDGQSLPGNPHPKGVVRREDVRLHALDTLLIQECFLPGDKIVAKVISLGDTRSYFLSTKDEEYGVYEARSKSGNALVPVQWDTMKDAVTGEKEPRKVGRPKSSK